MQSHPCRSGSTAALFLLFAFQQAYSQVNFVPGSVFTSTNDTLSGLIDYRNWSKNPKSVSFQPLTSGSITTYSPTEIKGFQVKDDTYLGAVVDIEVSPTNKPDETQQANLRKDTVFLQVLVQGEKSLLYYRTVENKDNFYIAGPRGFELLIYKKYQNADGLIAENKNYQRQLAYYLSDCPTIQERLKNTNYFEASLTKLFQYYFSCTGTAPGYQPAKGKIKAEMALTAGGSITSLNFESEGFPYLVNAGFRPSFAPAFGLSVNFIFPRNQGKWAFFNDLLYSSYKVSGESTQRESATNFTDNLVTLGFSYLMVTNMLRYQYTKGEVRPFFQLGLSNGFMLSSTNYRKRGSSINGIERTEETLALEELRTYEQSLMFGAGLRYQKLSVEYRPGIGNGMSKFSNLSAGTTRHFFLLSYVLW